MKHRKHCEALCSIQLITFAFFNDLRGIFVEYLWSNGLVVKVLDSQSRGHVFKTTGWLQG